MEAMMGQLQEDKQKHSSRQLERISQNLIVGGAYSLKTIFTALPESEQTKLKCIFDRVDRLLEDSAKELLSLSPPAPGEVANCAAQHLQEGLNHLEQDDYEEARISFDQSARLLKIVDRMVQ
jgi:hypothetical protein